MINRIELNNLSNSISQSMVSWDGGALLHLNAKNLTMTQLSQDILAQLNPYLSQEKSLRGRLETLQKLDGSLDVFKNQILNPDSQKDLINLIRKVRQTISATIQKQKDLEGQ